MGNELSVVNGSAQLATQQNYDTLLPKIMEDLLLAGDLAKLTAPQRVSFYGSVCQSLGLNPLTKPFDYLNLSGKLVLYAGKGCAEQLRLKHRVSLKITNREVIDGVYVVTARATMPDGREDEATGAVPLVSAAADRAIAYMRAETKAKRRVTLSICGLGMLDESEVDVIRGARTNAVDLQTGEIDTGGHPVGTQAAANAVADRKIAEMQKQQQPHQEQNGGNKSKDFFAMLKAFKEIKPKIGTEAYYRILGSNGYEKSDQIPDATKGRAIYAEMEACRRAQQKVAEEQKYQPAQEAEREPQPAATMADLPDEMWAEGRE